MSDSDLGWDDMPGMEGMSTDDAVGDWTDAEWAEWFSDVVKPSHKWQGLMRRWDGDYGDFSDELKVNWDGDKLGKSEAVPAPDYYFAEGGLADIIRIMEGSFAHDPLLPSLTAPSFESVFSRMSYESKKRFFEGWYAMTEKRTSKPSSMQEPEPDEPEGEITVPDRAWVNITLPNGNVVTIETGELGEPKSWDIPAPEPETPEERTRREEDEAMRRWEERQIERYHAERRSKRLGTPNRKPSRKMIMAAGGGAAAILAFSLIIPQLTGNGSPSQTSIPAAASGTTVPDELDTPATTLTGCAAAAAAAKDHIMTFSSPDLPGGAIPERYAAYNSSASNGFPTPGFEFGNVPEGTTELAIVIQNVPEWAQDEVSAATDLWTTSVPPGSPYWILTGISPDATEVPSTATGVELPEGLIARDHNTYGAGTSADDMHYNRFVGAHTGELFLFTLFAICEPEGDWYDPANLAWMRGWTIATTWFTARAGF